MNESASTETPLSGTLDLVPLKQILDVFRDSGATGSVRIGSSGAVWCEGGMLVLATSAASPALADVLFSANVGSLEELHTMLDQSSDVGVQLAGQDPQAEPVLRRLLHEHNLNALFELLVPSDAAYEIEAEATHPIGSHFGEPLDAVVEQAESRLEIWRQIAARIPSTTVVLRPVPELPDGLVERVVSADEWRYITQLDGKRSVADIITLTGESAFRVCSGLYRLLLEGLIVD